METIKITVATVTIKKEGTNQKGEVYKIREITDAEGKKYDSFDEFKEGETVEVTLKPNANPAYSPNIMRPKEQKVGAFPKKDWTFEKRKASLECAVGFAKSPTTTIGEVIKNADEFFQYLNK